jgi:2-oxoglutarate dehydrogenase E1 component
MLPHQGDLNPQNTQYVEALLDDYLADPKSVSPEWQQYFQRFTANGGPGLDAAARPTYRTSNLFNSPSANGSGERRQREARHLQRRADQLVNAYRTLGHLAANLDPLELAPRDGSWLEPELYGLSEADRGRQVVASTNFETEQTETLAQLVERLSAIYCGSIGFEFMHINDRDLRQWMLDRVEAAEQDSSLSHEVLLRIFSRLTGAVIFEQFVRKKYVGAKTFSLEGGETLIPLLDMALSSAASQGIDEVVVGMAHRGRLNVLANIVGKRPVEIFREFEDQHPDWWRGRGDVKYHLGFSGDWESPDQHRLHISLCFNPSHLEFINPVALGRLRAKQDRIGDLQRQRGLTILIHGDAGFAGEGVVQESLNLSGLEGYHTGGALHVVVNNQLGFTTPPAEARSTRYASDIATSLQLPVFHVNGECPRAVARVVELAMDFRARFGRDVVIDMYCFRRWGHNEADEPSFTQPLMYQAIEHHRSIHDRYLEQLLEMGQLTRAEADQVADEHYDELSKQFEEAQEPSPHPTESPPAGVWEPFCGGPEPDDEVDTGVATDTLRSLLGKLATTPDGFHLHKKLRRAMQHRQQMAQGEVPLDWSAAEALAFATLAVEGHPVRLAGQDSARGTFSQRHAVLFDAVDGHALSIFEHVADDQAPVQMINSPLSEAGALGFEYGYSLDYPDALVLWEAQFGDFINAAQVIVDQFIASAEDKWRRLSGVVLLLPHGYEGKGPEHSSARLERFLNLAVEDNLQVVVPSTPAQYFHVLRRQVHRTWRKPLIIFTPKSLLRHPRVVSPLDDISGGRFRRILADVRHDPSKTSCVLLTSGKVYYELAEYREQNERTDVAILRVEQLYPLADDAVSQALECYANETPVRWIQEEPENMGAWPYLKNRYCYRLLERFPLTCVARPPSASPATGSSAAHKTEQRELIEQAFAPTSK